MKFVEFTAHEHSLLIRPEDVRSIYTVPSTFRPHSAELTCIVTDVQNGGQNWYVRESPAEVVAKLQGADDEKFAQQFLREDSESEAVALLERLCAWDCLGFCGSNTLNVICTESHALLAKLKGGA